jgi:hypothetical protein
MSEHDQNRRIAEAIGAHFCWNGRTFHEGEYIALLDGNIVAVTKKPDEAITALRALDPDPRRGMVIEVSRPTVDVIR